jgi:hypothetical protein
VNLYHRKDELLSIYQAPLFVFVEHLIDLIFQALKILGCNVIDRGYVRGKILLNYVETALVSFTPAFANNKLAMAL